MRFNGRGVRESAWHRVGSKNIISFAFLYVTCTLPTPNSVYLRAVYKSPHIQGKTHKDKHIQDKSTYSG